MSSSLYLDIVPYPGVHSCLSDVWRSWDKGFEQQGLCFQTTVPCWDQSNLSYSISQYLLNIWLMPGTVLSDTGIKAYHAWPLFFSNPESDWEELERHSCGKIIMFPYHVPSVRTPPTFTEWKNTLNEISFLKMLNWSIFEKL